MFTEIIGYTVSKELSLRISIHEAEIIFENNNIFGDAVNIPESAAIAEIVVNFNG